MASKGKTSERHSDGGWQLGLCGTKAWDAQCPQAAHDLSLPLSVSFSHLCLPLPADMLSFFQDTCQSMATPYGSRFISKT